jgi:hypothetical protein
MPADADVVSPGSGSGNGRLDRARVCTLSQQGEQQMSLPLSQLERFKQCIVGDFNNDAQIEQEKAAGRVIHARARHVNRILDDKIDHIPPDLKGFFLLEESYYIQPDGSTKEVPHLFLFQETENGEVQLVSFENPPDVPLHDLRNDNDQLRFDYRTLKPSFFKPMTYHYNEATGEFTGTSVNPLPGGKEFTLDEVITTDRLQVVECMRIDGVVQGYSDQPILYDRV